MLLNELIGMPRPNPTMVDWDLLEADLGLVLPSDYKNLISKYGSVRFDEFLGVLHPYDEGGGHSLAEWASIVLEGAREIAEDSPEDIPYPLYPEPGGIFPWAVTDNADRLFWRTVGEPDSWTVVVAARDYEPDDWWEFPGSMSEFLVSVLTGAVRCPVLVEDFPSSTWTAEQYRSGD